MRLLAILFFSLLGGLWFYFILEYIQPHLHSDIETVNLTILLSGLFIIGLLCGRTFKKEKVIYIENSDTIYSYTGDTQKKETFIPVIEKIEDTYPDENIEDTFIIDETIIQEEGVNDNLKIIEGIGPKIESLLHNGNIYSYQELSQLSTDQIRKILEKGGPRYTLHNPSSWPKQALLADQKKFDTLEIFQRKLIKGVEQ